MALFPAVKRPGRVAHSWVHLLPVLRMHVAAVKIPHTDYFSWLNLTFTFYATFYNICMLIPNHASLFSHTLTDSLRTLSSNTGQFSPARYVWINQELCYRVHHVCPVMHLYHPPVLGQHPASLQEQRETPVWPSLYRVLQSAPPLVSNLITGSHVLNIAACRRVGKKPL